MINVSTTPRRSIGIISRAVTTRSRATTRISHGSTRGTDPVYTARKALSAAKASRILADASRPRKRGERVTPRG